MLNEYLLIKSFIFKVEEQRPWKTDLTYSGSYSTQQGNLAETSEFPIKISCCLLTTSDLNPSLLLWLALEDTDHVLKCQNIVLVSFCAQLQPQYSKILPKEVFKYMGYFFSKYFVVKSISGKKMLYGQSQLLYSKLVTYDFSGSYKSQGYVESTG